MPLPGGSAADSPMAPPRLFIDLSEVVDTDYGTGIHRVVRNLARVLLQSADASGRACLPVAHARDGGFRDARGYAQRVLGVDMRQAQESPPAPGDTLLLLDSAWEHPERFLARIEGLHAAGGRAGAFVYDLIPLRFPQYCVDFMPPIFERWLRFVVANCDFLVCISRSVANDLKAWIDESAAPHRAVLQIGHIHLGADIGESLAPSPPGAQATEAMEGGHSVLMVGTLEPRKRHDLALVAFERAWELGAALRLVIMGKQGWHVEGLAERILGHRELGHRLFWVDRPSDSDLQHGYRSALCLLQASDAEGFGLPIVEAARYATPLLLSDIPVFREIAGTHAGYFRAGDAGSLLAWLMPGGQAPTPSSPDLAITWGQSAKQLLDLLSGDGWDHVVNSI